MARESPQALRIYLAGPVSGMIDEAKLVFAEAEAELRRVGYVVVNPLKTANSPKAEAETRAHGRQAAGMPEWQQVMRQCVRDMLTCDGLMLLPGWTRSRGARLERHVAREVGMSTQDYGEWFRLRHA